MADFERKLTMLAERGTPVGPEEMIERVEAELASDPLVVVSKQRKGWGMHVETEQKREKKRGSAVRGLGWAAGAFIAVVGIAILLFAAGGGGEAEVVDNTVSTTLPTPSSTVPGESTGMGDVVGLGLGALFSGDFDTAAQYLDMGQIDPELGEQGWRQLVEYHDLMGSESTASCDEREPVSTVVICAISVDSQFYRVFGEPEAEEFTVSIEDGRVTSIERPHNSSAPASLGIYLAETGQFDGYEKCVNGEETVECAQIQLEHLDGLAEWLQDFDPRERVERGLTAWFEGDCVLAIVMFAGPITSQLDDCVAGSAPDWMAYEWAIEADVEVIDCSYFAEEETAECIVTYSNALHEAVGAEPAQVDMTFNVSTEKALWTWNAEFYRFPGTYLRDSGLDASFASYAEIEGFDAEHDGVCRPARSVPACADLKLRHIDDWAVWHQANNA